MTDMTEVRKWARENGRGVSVRGPLPAAVIRDYEEATQPADEDEPFVDVPAPGVPDVPDLPAPPAEPAKARREEVKPQGKKVSAADRFRQRLQTVPKTRHKRVSIEDLVSGIWGLGGMALMQHPATVPVGRVLAVQSGVAGIIVEDVAKGTVVDRILQPLARMEDKGRVALALAGPPVLVGLITARPELGPAVRPVLKAAMMSWMEISAPALEKAQKRAAKWQEEFGGIDLDAIIDSFWSTEGLPVVESEAEEDAIRRARGDS